MDPERYQRLKEIFEAARALPRERQRSKLREACGDDEELLVEIEALLDLDREAPGDALDRSLLGDGAVAADAEGVPERIGRYRILSVCGFGGMGTVYEAEQEAPKRRVALKVVQVGALRPETLSRFRREAEILGRLQHPGIAQIFEAGEFEQAGVTLPFFAMEFVEGLPLTEHAERQGLDTRARVELFCRVCDAVHHAHQEGVVHRDLKPENVLVAEVSISSDIRATDRALGQPKVLDFGVARLAESGLEATLATGAGQLLGSVPYMSPEQASADPTRVDTRSDVYALGVLLYELLTGKLPLPIKGRPLGEALTLIQEREPRRLSAESPAHRGDLETIVRKCLEKDPAWRYSTAAELADDLRRFLVFEPVVARPPSSWYQLRKFARRNRILVGGVGAVLVTALVGVIVAVGFAMRASRNEGRAITEAYRANISAAHALLSTDPVASKRALHRVPEDRRGWEWRYLESQLSSDILDLGRIFDGTPIVPFDGGRRIAAGRDDRALCVWDVTTGEIAKVLEAPTSVTAWGISEDATRIAAGLADGRLFVREQSGDWETWDEREGSVTSIVFSKGADRLAVVRAGELSVGDASGWVRAQTSDSVLVAFDPRGETLAGLLITPGSSTGMRTWDARTLVPRADTRTWDAPRCLAFAPEGDELVVGLYQRVVLALDAETLEAKQDLIGHQRAVCSVAFAPDGRMVSASTDGTIRVWDRETADSTHVLSAPGTTRAVFAGPDRIASASEGRLRLWELNRNDRGVLRDHASYVYQVVFSGDGTKLVALTFHDKSELSVWDVVGGRRLFREEGHPAGKWFLGFGRGGLVATGGGYSTHVTPWAGGPRQLRESLAGFGHALMRRPGQKTPDELHLGGAATRWGPPEGLTVWRTEHSPHDEENRVRAFADGVELELEGREESLSGVGDQPRLFVGCRWNMIAHMDGEIAELVVYGGRVTGSDARRVESYLAARRRGETSVLAPIESAPLLAHFRADGESVRTGADSSVLRWTAASDPSFVLEPRGVPASAVTYLPPDGKAPGRVSFHNVSSNLRWLEAPFPEAEGLERMTVFWLGRYSGDRRASNATAYSIGTTPNDFLDWPERERVMQVGTARATSTDGRFVAQGWTNTPGGEAFVRDTKTQRDVAVVPGRHLGVALHPTGHRVVCGGRDGQLVLWDVEANEELARTEAHAGEVYAVAWSPDGTRIASGGNDSAIRLWDAETLAVLLELRGHRLYVKSLAFSPDGTRLASASGDRTVRIWDSVPPSARYAQKLEARRLETEVRASVDRWVAESEGPSAVARKVERTWDETDPRRDAAMRVLALASSRGSTTPSTTDG